MKIPDPKEYQLTFETQGTTPLFEDLICQAYNPPNAISIFQNGSVKVFAHKNTVLDMNIVGEGKTVAETEEVIKTLVDLLEKTESEVQARNDKASFGAEDAEMMLARLKEISDLYKYFDFNYWETVYAKAKENSHFEKNIALIGDFKNKVREKIGAICFNPDNYMHTLLRKAGEVMDIDAKHLHWHTEKEILDLLKHKNKIGNEVIAGRQRCFITYKDASGTSYFIDGSDAIEFAKVFTDNNMQFEENMLKGQVAYAVTEPIQGRVRIITMNYGNQITLQKDMVQMEEGEILVTQTTSPEFMPALKKARGIVTDLGGLLSHAAITARELKTPCIVNTKAATKMFKTGDLIELDTKTGIVKLLSK